MAVEMDTSHAWYHGLETMYIWGIVSLVIWIFAVSLFFVIIIRTCRFPGVMDVMQQGLGDKNELTTKQISVFDPFLGHITVSSHSFSNWL